MVIGKQCLSVVAGYKGCHSSFLQVMDRPGCGREGSLLHLDGLGVPDPERVAEEEEEDRRREEEEEERGRAEEIKDLLAGAFDDLEESEWESCGETHEDGRSTNEVPATLHGRKSASPHPEEPLSHLQEQHREDRDSLHEETGIGMSSFAREREQTLESNSSGLTEQSDSGSLTPWSEDSHDSSPQLLPPQAHLSTNTTSNNLAASLQQKLSQIECGSTSPQHREEHCEVPENNEKCLRLQCNDLKTSHEHLKLLYQERGRLLDQQIVELSSLKFERDENNRALVQKISLLESEVMKKTTSINQLQIQLSEKEDEVVNLLSHRKDLKDKYDVLEKENKRLVSELGTAQSDISSLESLVSELRAANGLTKEQKLENNNIKKLEEEKDVLLEKNQALQEVLNTMQQKVNQLEEELLHKAKMIATQNHVNNLLKEELLSSPGNQQFMQLKQQVESLQASKQALSSQVSALEGELSKTKAALEACDVREKKICNLEDPDTLATYKQRIEELELKMTTLREKHHPNGISNLLSQEEIEVLKKEAQEKRDLESECRTYQEKLQVLSSIIERQQEVIGDRQQYKNHFIMVQEASMKKNKQELDIFKDSVRKHARVILALAKELEDEQAKVQQKEEEVKKLTDMIQDLELEIQKLLEKNKEIRSHLQGFLVEQQAEVEKQKQKTKKVEEEWKNKVNNERMELKEVKGKHKQLKVKCMKYRDEMEACVDHYRGENSRLMQEFEVVKHKLTLLFKTEIGKFRDACVTGVEEIICHLRGMESIPGPNMYSYVMQMIPELEEFLTDLKNSDFVAKDQRGE